jgi:LacI family transcriptional regulator
MPVKSKSQRATLAEVAKRARVGIATVDRVLNERGGVSLKTSVRVLAAARALRLKRLLPTPHHRIIRIEVLLTRPETPFFSRVNDEFRRLSLRLDHSIVVQRTLLPDEKPETMARAMRQSSAEAIIVYTLEHEAIHKAVAANAARGVATITIVSDLPKSKRRAYAGNDHYQAGRTAGYFVDRMVGRAGPVLVLCNRVTFNAHAARIRGFGDYLDAGRRGLHITEIFEGEDDEMRSELVMREALRRHPGAVAIYNTGGANRTVAAVIGELDPKPIFVGHELDETSRAPLRDGVMALVIDQNPDLQARLALEVALESVGLEGPPWIASPRWTAVPFTLYGPENMLP